MSCELNLISFTEKVYYPVEGIFCGPFCSQFGEVRAQDARRRSFESLYEGRDHTYTKLEPCSAPHWQHGRHSACDHCGQSGRPCQGLPLLQEVAGVHLLFSFRKDCQPGAESFRHAGTSSDSSFGVCHSGRAAHARGVQRGSRAHEQIAANHFAAASLASRNPLALSISRQLTIARDFS